MRIVLVVPSFCKPELLEQCLIHLKPELDANPQVERVIFSNPYPIRPKATILKTAQLARQFEFLHIVSPGDIGLHNGLNQVVKAKHLGPYDVLIGVDPDDRPTPGFIKAMTETMVLDSKIAVLGLSFKVIAEAKKNSPGLYVEKKVGDYRVWEHRTVEMWNIACYRMFFILGINGFKEQFAYYGGLESALYPEWVKAGMHLSYLADYNSEAAPVDKRDPHYFDQEYKQWKDMHITNQFKGSFDAWLIKFAPRLREG